MNSRKLNYHIHDPNPQDTTAELLLKIFIEVDAPKVEKLLRQAVEKQENSSNA